MELIIPKRMEYVKLKLINILNVCKKIDSTKALINSLEAVIELCREDIRKIAVSKGLYFADFDWAFKEGAAMTMATLKKNHLRTIQRVLKCNSIDEMTRILIQRIFANMRNITTDARYSKFVEIKIGGIAEAIHIASDEIDCIIELESFDNNTIKEGLKNVWIDAFEDFDFDEKDFQELCEKFGFTVNEVMGENTILLKAEQIAGGNRQLVLFFDPND